MRKTISFIAVIAVIVQGPVSATAQGAQSGKHTPPPVSGLCSNLPPLPHLGSERNDQQKWRERYREARSSEAPEVIPDARGEPSMPAPASAPGAAMAVDVEAKAAGGAPARNTTEAARTDESARIMPWPDPPHPDYPRRPPYPQSGLLTAGEHDDLLNPELYANYVRRSNLGQAVRDLPLLDTARVLTVAVKDDAGRPVPFARVEMACANGRTATLDTLADGTVAFFPAIDRLGSRVRLRVPGEAWREVAIARDRGGQRVEFVTGREGMRVRKLDLMLAIDTTGSMGDEIRYLQTELAAILDALRARHPGLDLRVGFVFYRDIGDDYVTATVPLTPDFPRAQAELRQRWAGGGGDYPEAMDQALIRAAGQAWRPDAVKTLLLVADAPPHDENIGTAWLAARHLRAKRVQIVPVAASGVAETAEYAMRGMAALTQSRYTFLTDDSGIGNPHAPPAIDCYLVTRLNDLLRRVIDSQLSGRRIEPADQEVIRRVGQYDNGRCIIPRGALQQQ